MFPSECYEFFKNTFLIKHLRAIASISNDIKHKLRRKLMDNDLRNYIFSRAAVFRKMARLKCLVSSRLEMFYKKTVLKIFAKFTGKRLKNASNTGVFLYT